MSISIIVTRSLDADLSETSETISLEDWLNYVRQQDDLRLRVTNHEALSPNQGEQITIRAAEGESEVLIKQEYLPFLRYREGELVIKLYFDHEAADNPVRQRVAQVARHFNAIITHDSGDEVFHW